MDLKDLKIPWIQQAHVLGKELKRFRAGIEITPAISNSVLKALQVESAAAFKVPEHLKMNHFQTISTLLEMANSLPNPYLQSLSLLQANSIATSALQKPSAIAQAQEYGRMQRIRNAFFHIKEDDWVLETENPFEESAEEAIEPGPTYITEGQKVRSIIESVWLDNQELYTLKPRDFERMTAELLRNQGFETHLTKETRDGGYDIWAIFSIKGLKPFKMLVECKRFRNDRPVGIEIVRSFRTVMSDEKVNRGMIVTTSYFSDDAKKKEQETPYLLECRDRDDILDWIRDYKGPVF